MTIRTTGPPDGGWGWMCAVGKLYCYLIMLGTSSAFGAIYVGFIDHFNTTRQVAAWIGSLCIGLTLTICPLSSVLTTRCGIRKTTAAGSLIAFTGCFISCFANGIPYLYVSYGVVMGIGLGLLIVPCNIIVLQYFKRRLGLANAIGSAGNGIGTLVLPPLYTYLLEEYGWRGTLMLLSGIILNGLVCAFLFIPPTYLTVSKEISSSQNKKSTSYRKFLQSLCNLSLILYLIGTTVGGCAYYIPFVHLPDMAIQMGIDKYQAAYLISVVGIASIVGRIVFGWISDFQCVNVIVLQGVSLLVCGGATAICPHLQYFYALVAYAVIYGIFIGVFVSLIPLGILTLVGLDRTGDVIGVLYFFTGILDTLASPLAGWLFDITNTYNASFSVASSLYFFGGVLTIVAIILHSRRISSNRVEFEQYITTVSKSHGNPQQDNDTPEQTHM